MDFILLFLIYFCTITGYLGIVKLISFILNLFRQKFRFFASAIIIAWITEISLLVALKDIEALEDIVSFIISQCLFLCILYLCGKMRKTSFSIFEYIFSFIVYLPSQFIPLFTYLIILGSLGYPL